MKKKQYCGRFCIFTMIVIFMLGCHERLGEDRYQPTVSEPVLSGRPTPVPTEQTASKLTREGIFNARKKFEVKVLLFDSTQEFGVEFPYSDYVRLRITNNSDLILPYLTVLTKRFDKSGKMIGSSRAPSIPANNIKPGESFEYDYYPRGHLPGVSKITVEIEHVINDDEMQFFKEFQ